MRQKGRNNNKNNNNVMMMTMTIVKIYRVHGLTESLQMTSGFSSDIVSPIFTQEKGRQTKKSTTFLGTIKKIEVTEQNTIPKSEET